jgi:RNA polymerase sigma-70 factor (ECF subfamily)
MSLDLRERGRWLACNVLPHEPLIRAKLRDLYIFDLEVDDVIQEMYARILSVPLLESIRYPRQYAVLTARAIVVDHIRHSRVVSITSCGTLETLEVPLTEPSTEKRLEFRDEVLAVADGLAQLPKVCRETLILRRVEGLSQKQVAERLKISEKTVEKHMANGVRLLIRLFGRGGKPRVHTSNTREEPSIKDVVQEPGD